MKKIILVLLLFLNAAALSAQLKHNASTPVDPVTVPLPESERGLVITRVIEDSEIYPNTRRKVQIFIPKQYDGKNPAALLVGLDGNLFGAITVIDNLIKRGEMPVTIGVFVEPGLSLGPDSSVVRYNRSNEFDRTNGEFASFLETEVLPMVESITLPCGRPILISKDPNDRAITGASSSGIAAFTVAWERPDLFSRVYSSVGTFVAMRGGNEYPAIIRKTEPKRLRVFLQDGVNDTWNHIFGDWWEYNQLMASALNFAGYEFDYKWDRGTHSIYYGTRAYPDAMRWLWRGWPQRVQSGKSMNGMLNSLLIEGEDWQEVESDETLDCLLQKGAMRSFVAKRVGPVRNAADSCRLYDGTTYVSDAAGNIWLLRPGANNPVKLNTLPQGGSLMAIYPNNRMLVTTEQNSNWLISYIISEDGTLTAGQRFYWLHNTENHTQNPYGNMIFDTDGNLFIATPQGIQVCDQNGRVRAILQLPSKGVDAIALLGNTLYALSGGKIYMRKINHIGHNSWERPIDVKSQGQG